MPAQLALRNDFVDPLSIWAEREDRARLVVRDDLGVVWRNGAATRFIIETGRFRLIHNRLAPRDCRWSQALLALVGSSNATPSLLCIPGPPGENARCTVLCTALGLGDDGGGRMTGLTLRCARDDVPLHSAALRDAFHLTLSERRIVEMMFSGRTAEEVGTELCVAIGTVRVHIRHIYEKLNVASREAMFHALVPFLSID